MYKQKSSVEVKLSNGGKRPGAGRPKGSKSRYRGLVVAEARRMAKEEAKELAEKMVEGVLMEWYGIVTNNRLDASDRIKAGIHIMETAHGKATQSFEVAPQPTQRTHVQWLDRLDDLKARGLIIVEHGNPGSDGPLSPETINPECGQPD